MLQQTKINYIALSLTVKKIMALLLIGTGVKEIIINTVNTVPKEEPVKMIIPATKLYGKIFLQYFSPDHVWYNRVAFGRLILYNWYEILMLLFYLYHTGRISLYLFWKFFSLIRSIISYYSRTKNFNSQEWQEEFTLVRFLLRDYCIRKVQEIKLYLQRNYKKLLIYSFILLLSTYLYWNRRTLPIFKPLRRSLRKFRRYMNKLDQYYLREI